MSRERAAKYKLPIYRTVADALTLGGDKLAFDGVLLIGEHGDYPMNDKAQKLYPRFEMFLKITDVFRQTGRSEPVFNDKHLSWSWHQAKRMVDISRELRFPMLARSSVPIAYMGPAIDAPYGQAQRHAVAIPFSGLNIYGFHVLEWVAMHGGTQEGRRDRSSIRSMPAEPGLLEFPGAERLGTSVVRSGIDTHRNATGREHARSVEGADGVRDRTQRRAEGGGVSPHEACTGFYDRDRCRRCIETCIHADESPGRSSSSSLRLPGGEHRIVFETGKPPYPVERTMLTSGILDSSHAFKGIRSWTLRSWQRCAIRRHRPQVSVRKDTTRTASVSTKECICESFFFF
jgi:hypothetical protein